MPRMLWERGRWALIFEPCDFWWGVFYDRRKQMVYIIFPVPMLPVRYTRKVRPVVDYQGRSECAGQLDGRRPEAG
jgi:hypothetical protein